jgi:hypothetical protein
MERVVWRDSIVTLPGDTIEFQVPCDNDTVFILKGNSSRALVQVKNHEVHVENDCDEQSRIITGLISEINTIKSHSNDSSKTVTLPVKFIPAWYKFTNKAFYVESLLLLLFLGYTFRKPIALILGA